MIKFCYMVRGCDRGIEMSFALLKTKKRKIQKNQLIKIKNLLAKASI